MGELSGVLYRVGDTSFAKQGSPVRSPGVYSIILVFYFMSYALSIVFW